MILKGIGVSEGVGFAESFHYHEQELKITYKYADDQETELTHLNNALNKAENDINSLKKIAKLSLSDDDCLIFDAHLSILNDPELLKEVKQFIKEGYSAPYAYEVASNYYLDLIKEVEDEYLRARSIDFNDVFKRVIANLLNLEQKPLTFDKPVILVVKDLTPSSTASLDFKFVKGIISEHGSFTSHASIIARTLGIPAIVGIPVEKVPNNTSLIIDGRYGQIITDPTTSDVAVYNEYLERISARESRLALYRNKATVTKDGHQVKLALNIANLGDLKGTNISEGIGLYRTEFLYMEKVIMPSETEQEKAYLEALESNKKELNIIRTLDIGGDKALTYLNIKSETNPFLGNRAIRLSLTYKDIFKTQLRALLKANIYGNLGIMIPMVSTVEEIIEAKALISEVETELIKEGNKINTYQFGIMIEVPIAALNVGKLLKEVDFISIGSNDLIQYLFAADRMNDSVNYLYQPYHPSFLRLIKHVIDEAKKQNKMVGLCGEIAANKDLSLVLVGLGIDELSMMEGAILPIREILSKVTYQELKEISQNVFNYETNEEVKIYLKEMLQLIERR
jgi:phosphotransferase system enzyme I (PtsI)